MFRTFERLFGFLMCHKSLASSSASQGQRDHKESRNIVILGSLGTGKSSLVNMLVGRVVAPVSSSVGVAHPPIVEYPIPLREILGDGDDPSSPLQGSDSDLIFKFYDTIGLEYRPSPWDPINARLRRGGGVHVVVYCMRRGRLSSEQVTHLDTIWKTLCRSGDVPLVLVIIDVDHRRGSAEQWWEANGEQLENVAQVRFADHICLNAWGPTHPSWKDQEVKYEETQKHVRNLVIRYCKSLHSVV